MDIVTTYLESGSINGLNHIASTKKWEKLFWILVVNGGFVISGFLIVEMYIEWGDNPIRTDVDTSLMSKVRFPKVTVCPPKDTFTDLNYDIMRAEKKNLTLKERDELYKFARDTIENITFMENLNQLHDEDRFYNWYHANSQLYGSSIRLLKNLDNTINIKTMATSGVITSHLFGKKFDKNLFVDTVKNFGVEINIIPPKNFSWNEQNLTLHFQLEKVSVPGLNRDGGSEHAFYFPGVGDLADDENTAYSTFTPEVDYIESFTMYLDLENADINDLEMVQMPGFNFSWWYTGGNIEPGNIYIKKCKDDWKCQDPDDLPIYQIYREFVRAGVFFSCERSSSRSFYVHSL